MGAFPKLGGTLLGVPIIRIIKFVGLYWGPPTLGNYMISPNSKRSASMSRSERKTGILYAPAICVFVFPLVLASLAFLWDIPIPSKYPRGGGEQFVNSSRTVPEHSS